jgi:hypothetical protein
LDRLEHLFTALPDSKGQQFGATSPPKDPGVPKVKRSRQWTRLGVLAGSGAGDRSRDNVAIAQSPEFGWLAVSRLSSATEHGSWTSDSRTALLDVMNQDRLFNRRKGPRASQLAGAADSGWSIL